MRYKCGRVAEVVCRKCGNRVCRKCYFHHGLCINCWKKL